MTLRDQERDLFYTDDHPPGQYLLPRLLECRSSDCWHFGERFGCCCESGWTLTARRMLLQLLCSKIIKALSYQVKATEEKSLDHVNHRSVHHFGPDWNVSLHHVRILMLAFSSMHKFAKLSFAVRFLEKYFPTGKIHMTKVNSGLMVVNFLSCCSNALNDKSQKKDFPTRVLFFSAFFLCWCLCLVQANK